MIPAVRRHRAAEAEIRDAFDYYFERAGFGVAARFRDELSIVLRYISDFPEAGSPYLRNTRRWRLRDFPYAVVYRLLPDGPYVVALIHAARKPGYWTERVSPR